MAHEGSARVAMGQNVDAEFEIGAIKETDKYDGLFPVQMNENGSSRVEMSFPAGNLGLGFSFTNRSVSSHDSATVVHWAQITSKKSNIKLQVQHWNGDTVGVFLLKFGPSKHKFEYKDQDSSKLPGLKSEREVFVKMVMTGRDRGSNCPV